VTEAPVLYPVNTALRRFGIANLIDSPDPFVSSMPADGLVNPLTGCPTAGPLAVLVDHVAGLVNHYRRAAERYGVSSGTRIRCHWRMVTGYQVVAQKPAHRTIDRIRPEVMRALRDIIRLDMRAALA